MPRGVWKTKTDRSEVAKKHGFGKWTKGRSMPEETKIKLRESCQGEKRYNWKGDGVGYRALHHWVWCWLGEPMKCEFCGKVKSTPKSIQWANKSGRYLRDLTDWISLCVPCHREYDKIHP